MSKWVEVTYISAWTNKKEKCVFTNAKAPGQWGSFNYCIFEGDEGSHVALSSVTGLKPSERELTAAEAWEWFKSIKFFSHQEPLAHAYEEAYDVKLDPHWPIYATSY